MKRIAWPCGKTLQNIEKTWWIPFALLWIVLQVYCLRLELIGGDAEEAEQKLNEIICDYVTEAYGEGLFGIPEQILAGYSAEEYNFYVEEGQIIVTFETYTFAPGAAGATVVPTGIMIGE